MTEKKPKNRSARLRKYEAVYNEYVKKHGVTGGDKDIRTKSSTISSLSSMGKGAKEARLDRERKSRQRMVENVKKKHSKPLTEYQKFVKTESKKDEYRELKPKDRLKEIGKIWKNRNVAK